MNCEQIREALDYGNHSDAVAGHLSGCGTCRRHETELSGLLSLLSAQPRVTVPAGFELRLQARLASEEVKLAALVNSSLPLVAAPADFNFRLRARLAQLKTAKASNPLAWVEQLARSFSFGQAATAMAALVLLVAFSVAQLNRNQTPVTPEALVALAPATGAQGVTQPAMPAVQEQVMPTVPTVKVAPRVVRQPLAARTTVFTQAAAVSGLIAHNAAEQAVYNATTRQETRITRSGYAYGQQLAKMAAVTKADPMTF